MIKKRVNFNIFSVARDIVEQILKDDNETTIRQKILDAEKNIQEDMKRDFYRHMSSLFLNVLLNRLDETSDSSERKSLESRKIIAEIIKTL
jgi:hypothetical protein